MLSFIIPSILEKVIFFQVDLSKNHCTMTVSSVERILIMILYSLFCGYYLALGQQDLSEQTYA